jgi:ACS family tartrate transporter-like MFS transporter
MSTLSTPVSDLEKQTISRVTRRLIPFLALLFIVAFLDRTNVGFAALRMNQDIGISQTLYGFGAGIFFLGYFIFEVPSNIFMHRYGARLWIARIMVTWGIVASVMGMLQTPVHFVVLRALLGVAEAGFFPGVIYLLSLWFPARYRAQVIAGFYLGVPISQVIGAPLSVSLIELGEHIGVTGWRLMYVLEGLPAILLGVVCWFYLSDRPSEARWLTDEQRNWLMRTLAAEEAAKPLAVGKGMSHGAQIRTVLKNRVVWAMALTYFGITSGSNAMNFFFPSVLQSFQESFGIKLGLLQNGLITAIPYALAGVAMFYWSRRSDRKQERYVHVASAALLAAVSIAIALVVDHPLATIVGFILLAIGVYSAVITFWAIPGQVLTGVGAAAGIGLINSVGNLSGFAGPYLIGLIKTATGSYTPGFLLIAALVGAGGVGALLLPRRPGSATMPIVTTEQRGDA